jgi:hypothetical protein
MQDTISLPQQEILQQPVVLQETGEMREVADLDLPEAVLVEQVVSLRSV